LPRKPRHGPKQPRRQPARHHPGAARQRCHGQARVWQAQGVAEQPKPGQAAGRRARESSPRFARPWKRGRFPAI
jgi:hypothetical protein